MMKTKAPLLILTILLLGLNSIFSQDLNSLRKNISYQIGNWEDNKVQQTKDGRNYKFGYEVNWFDRNQTIIKIRVTGIFDDGEIRTFWEGFKHWNIQDKKMMYNGFSPDGRIAMGTVEYTENEIITYYSSPIPNGTIYIKDIAIKVDDDHFNTTTYLKRNDEEWKIVNEDHWHRVI